MNVEPSAIIAFSAALAGIAATWGALRGRIAALEDKIESVRTDQGRRLGELEKTTNTLVGRVDGFVQASRRARTAAHGIKVGDEHG